MKNIMIGAALSLLPTIGQSYEYKPMFTAQDLDVMAPIYQEMTGDQPTSIRRLRAMTIDLNGDGESEVLIRDESKCNATYFCNIVIGQFDEEDRKWKLLGESYGYQVSLGEFGEGYRNISIGSYSRSDVNHLTYQDGRYKRDLSRYGEMVDFTDAETAFEGKEDYLQRVLARGLGSRFTMIEQAISDDDRTLVAGADLNYDGEPEYMIYADYAAICDNSGCPLMIFSDLGKRPFAILHIADTHLAISDEVKEGKLKSIISDKGSFEWDTTGYEFKKVDQ